MKIESEIMRGISVAALFAAYVVLWSIKRKSQIKKDGFDPEILFKDTRPTQKFFVSASNIMTVVFIGLLISHSLGVKNIPGFYYFINPANHVFLFLGLFIGLLGLSLCFIAQKTMGTAWRVGIDEKTDTHLVENGIFSVCRNPTYLGLFMVCFGTIIIFPTMSFLTWSIVFVLMLEFQVRLEEEHLLASFGEKFIHYCKKTKRYIPLIY